MQNEQKFINCPFVTISGTKKILRTGFFYQIPYKNIQLKVLITNYHIINENFIKKNNFIFVTINDEKYKKNIIKF